MEVVKFITTASVNCPLCKYLSSSSAISTQRLDGVVGKTFVVESEILGSIQGHSRRAKVRPLISKILGCASSDPCVGPRRVKLEATKVDGRAATVADVVDGGSCTQ